MLSVEQTRMESSVESEVDAQTAAVTEIVRSPSNGAGMSSKAVARW